MDRDPSLPLFFSRALWLTFLSAFFQVAYADLCVVSPANNTQNLEKDRFILASQQFSNLQLAPLTQSLYDISQAELLTYNITGQVLSVTPSSVGSLSASDIALVSCDSVVSPAGYVNGSDTVSDIYITQKPVQAIVLYTTSSRYCSLAAGSQVQSQLPNVFTLVNPVSAVSLAKKLSATGKLSASILSNMTGVASSSGPVGTASSSSQSGSPQFPSPSPTTTVAMIVLYSITGVITALFLVVIVTGAVRAHRHPERYGPRSTAGRPRQSRARGLARAMLDTIPIVKFGASEDRTPDAVKGDLELGAGVERMETEQGTTEHREIVVRDSIAAPDAAGQKAPNHEHVENNESEATDTGLGDATVDNHPVDGNPVCPICTDAFVIGQDLRVLPCNHMFHPDCIDPWLVNVSGTCPLCRIDLNPPQEEGENEDEQGENAERSSFENAAEATPDVFQPRQHRRLTVYLQDTLNVRRMRDASVEERLAALRTVRQANRDTAAAAATGETQTRRRRLSGRFRERFRILTRQHGVAMPPTSESPSE